MPGSENILSGARALPSAPCLLLSFLLGCLTTPHAVAGSMPSQAQILSDMVLANNHFTNEWPTPGCLTCLPGGHPSTIWTRGTYFEGALALYRINHDLNIHNYAVQWGAFPNWGLRYGDTDTSPDDQCAGQEYIELYQFDTTQTSRLTHIANNVNYWLENGEGLKQWTYVDSIHMSMPAFAKLSVLNSNIISALKTNYTYSPQMYSYFHNIKSVYGPSNGLYNASDHLWWRDTTFLSNYTASDGTKEKCYWSRGNGWAFVALARTMDVLPANDPHYAEYLQTFRDMAAALIAVQRSDGFWNVNLAYANDYPGPESSGTACFTYGMAWGINRGYLDSDTYLPAVISGWNALAVGALHHSTGTDNGFLGYEQGSGDEPASGQPVTYTSVPDFDDFGLGLFLLAGSQVYRLNQAQPVLTWTNPAPITYGTALSSTQLDATASVPGAFAYSPTNGAVLSVGANTLSVLFTPTDTADYTSVTGSVSLVVLQAGKSANDPPAITTQPTGVTNSTVAGFKLTLTASGAAPMTYQWSFGGKVVQISTATATYSQVPATTRQSGQYSCLVTNAYGGVTSTVVSVLITNARPGRAVVSVPANLVAPQIAAWTFSGNDDFVISLNTVQGQTYELQSKPDLATGSWLPVVTNIPGTGGIVEIVDTNASSRIQRFYRVETGM
jgi:rhamnogalacturonyl hydrolase YesR